MLRDDRGDEILEAALVLPLVFMFLLGIVWFGRAFNINATITQAAQRGAVAAARPTCATCGNTFSSATAVATAVNSVMTASNLDTSQMTAPLLSGVQFCSYSAVSLANPGCSPVDNGNSGKIMVCHQVLLNASTNPSVSSLTQQCGTVVSFQYPFQFYLPFTSLNMQKITLTAQAQSRMEN